MTARRGMPPPTTSRPQNVGNRGGGRGGNGGGRPLPPPQTARRNKALPTPKPREVVPGEYEARKGAAPWNNKFTSTVPGNKFQAYARC